MKKFICLFLFGLLAYVSFGEDSTADSDATDDTWETNTDDCEEDGEIWLDSCTVCYCSCDTEEDADGAITKSCESRCKDMKSRYASDYVMEYCEIDCRYIDLEFYDSCDCPTCTNSTNSTSGTDESSDDSKYYNVSGCNDTDFRFEWGTYTIHDGDEVDYIEECQACVCYSDEDSDGVSFSKERCEEANWSGNWDRVSSYCKLDCDREYAVWDDSNCDCPSCSDTVQTDEDSDVDTTNDDSTVVDDSSDDDDDDSIYTTDEREYWDDEEGNVTHSIVAEFDITVSRIWDSRSDIWGVLKRAYRYIVEGSEDYVEDSVGIYISEWNAEVVDDTVTSDDVSSDTVSTDDDADAQTQTSDDVSSDTVDTTSDADGVTSDDVSSDTLDTGDLNTRRRRRRLRSRLRNLLEDGSSTADDADATTASETDTKDSDATDGSDNDDDADSTKDDTGDDDDDADAVTVTSDDVSSDTVSSDTVEDADEDSEEKTVNFKFAITFLDDNESNIDSWYKYLVGLGTSYEDEYIDNCDSESKNYRTSGFGTVTINSASLTQYSDDEVVVSVDYEGGTAVQSGSSQIYFVTIVSVSGLVTLLVSMFAM